MREEKQVLKGTKSPYLLPFKNLNLFSHQLNSQNNGKVLLLKLRLGIKTVYCCLLL